jgi:hypothetical protein
MQSLIADLCRRHGELEGVEAKAAHTGFLVVYVGLPEYGQFMDKK